MLSVVKYDKNENDAKNYENILQMQTRLTSSQNVKLPSNFSCSKGKEAVGTICIHFSNSESFHTLNYQLQMSPFSSPSISYMINMYHDQLNLETTRIWLVQTEIVIILGKKKELRKVGQ